MKKILIIWMLTCSSLFAKTDSVFVDKQLKLGVEKFNSREFSESLNIFLQVEHLAGKTKNSNHLFLAKNNIGLVHFRMLNYDKAISFFLDAYRIASSTKSESNKMIVLNNIALVYITENNYEKSIEYFEEAYLISKRLNKEDKTGIYACNLAKAYLYLSKNKIALAYIDEALSKISNKKRLYYMAKLIKLSINIESNFERKHIYELENILNHVVRKGFQEEIILTYLLLARSYSKVYDFNKSLYYSTLGVKYKPDLDTQMDLLIEMEKAARGQDNLTLLSTIKDSIIKTKLRIGSLEKKEKLEKGKLRIELIKADEKLILEKSKIKLAQQKFIYLTSSFVLIFLVLFFLYKKKTTITKEKLSLLRENLDNTDRELERQRKESYDLNILLQENQLKVQSELTRITEEAKSLEKDIELKNEELFRRVIFQNTKTELLEEIIGAITKNESGSMQNIHTLINQLKIHLKNDIKWTDIYETHNFSFIEELRKLHPYLNTNDIRFIHFLKQDLSNKEISILLNISPDACRKRKERLRKKLKLENEISLLDYMKSIDIVRSQNVTNKVT